MKTETFNEIVRVGDAGTPYNIKITIWYEELQKGKIIIHDSEDEGGPENQPLWWESKIGQIIDDHFPNAIVFQ